jgi:hypothetical protein
MRRTTITVNTTTYATTLGHQPRTQSSGIWMFLLDGTTEVEVRGTYTEALTQAKRQAQYSVKVLP